MSIHDRIEEQIARAVQGAAPWLPLIEDLLAQIEALESRVEDLEATYTTPVEPVKPEPVPVAAAYHEVVRPITAARENEKPAPFIYKDGKKLLLRGTCAYFKCNAPVYSRMKNAKYCSTKHNKLQWYYDHKDKPSIQHHGTPNGVTVEAGVGVTKGRV